MSTFSLYKKVPMGIGVNKMQVIVYVVEWVASNLTPPQVAEKIDDLHPHGGVDQDLYVLIEEQTYH